MAETSISTVNLSAVAGPNVPLGYVPATADYAGGYVFLASRRDSLTVPVRVQAIASQVTARIV